MLLRNATLYSHRHGTSLPAFQALATSAREFDRSQRCILVCGFLGPRFFTFLVTWDFYVLRLYSGFLKFLVRLVQLGGLLSTLSDECGQGPPCLLHVNLCSYQDSREDVQQFLLFHESDGTGAFLCLVPDSIVDSWVYCFLDFFDETTMRKYVSERGENVNAWEE